MHKFTHLWGSCCSLFQVRECFKKNKTYAVCSDTSLPPVWLRKSFGKKSKKALLEEGELCWPWLKYLVFFLKGSKQTTLQLWKTPIHPLLLLRKRKPWHTCKPNQQKKLANWQTPCFSNESIFKLLSSFSLWGDFFHVTNVGKALNQTLGGFPWWVPKLSSRRSSSSWNIRIYGGENAF